MQLLSLLETGILGLFFVQSLRMLIGQLYSRTASAALVTTYPQEIIPPNAPGIVTAEAISSEIIWLGLMIALPVLALILGRWKFSFIPAVALLAIGRALMVLPDSGISASLAAVFAVGGGLLYITLMVYQRATLFPYFFVLGFALDQVIRAFGNTLDPTIWQITRYQTPTIIIVGAVLLIAFINIIRQKPFPRGETNNNRGLLTVWGAVGLGGLLFLEMSLLALPNAIAGRADTDYTQFVPLVLAATVLPLVPFVRRQIRELITPFDSTTRGWIWLILLALLIVVGARIQRLPISGLGFFPLGGFALVLAQFAASMTWWWLVRPQAENERNLSGFWLLFTVTIFGLLVAGDIFTYEYAFVRDFLIPSSAGVTDFLNSFVTPLLRGFRGLGLGLLLMAALFATLPVIQSTRRIPWRGGKLPETLAALLFGITLVTAAAIAARPPLVLPVIEPTELRVGTYNIHGGYSEFFNYDLEAIAQTIEQSGAQVVLLQEVEAGRMTSFGVDQSLWLARRLGMDRRFYATNEGLQGLAVLSRVQIVFDDGVLLPSIDQQTGLQRVQIQPEANLQSVITIYNTSLGLLLAGPELNVQEENQRNQVDSILSTIATHINTDYGGQLGRALLGGTFHNVPSSPVIQRLAQSGFVDPFAGTNLTLSATLRRSNLPPARYDYIWLWSQSLQPIGTNVMPGDASDHRMAVVGIALRNEP